MISVFITLPLSISHPPSQFSIPIVIRQINTVNQHFNNKIQHFGITKLLLRLLVLYRTLQTRKMIKLICNISAPQILTEKHLLRKIKNFN